MQIKLLILKKKIRIVVQFKLPKTVSLKQLAGVDILNKNEFYAFMIKKYNATDIFSSGNLFINYVGNCIYIYSLSIIILKVSIILLIIYY